MSKSPKLVFFGTEDFSTPSLLSLLWYKFPVKVVVTKPDAKSGRGQKLSAPQVKKVASSHGIEVLQPGKVSEINQRLKELAPTHGVLVSYGKIIPQSTLDIFPGGIINVHPSLLPKYRGPSPIETTILNGDKATGISIIQLTSKMDAGPIYYQQPRWINNRADKQTLYPRLSQMGAAILAVMLPKILEGKLEPEPQDEAQATYTKLLKKADGVMDFSKPAERLEREVRAYQGWPRSQAQIHGNEVIVTKARVAKDKDDGKLVLKAKPGWLEITELIGPSGRRMSGADFLRGYKK